MSDWYYAVNNEQKGPVNESELKADLAQNKIPADTLVWKEGMDNWSPANTVSAFTFRPPPIPAKTQPPVTSAPAATKTPESTDTKAAAPATGAAANNPDSTKPVELSDILKKPEPLEVEAIDAESNKIFGIMAYFGPLFLVPMLTVKDSPYAKYHANQGFILCVLWVLVAIVLGVISMIIPSPLLNHILSLVYLPLLGLIVFGVVNAAHGKCVPLPVIGGIKLIK